MSYASKNHKGLDFNYSGGGDTDFGAPVLATHDGIVKIKNDTSGNEGRMITIMSKDGKFMTQYLHLSEILVKDGQEITESTEIGKIGGSGGGSERGRQVHLHYQIKKLNEKTGEFEQYNPTEGKGNKKENIVDPQTWIKKEEPKKEESQNNEKSIEKERFEIKKDAIPSIKRINLKDIEFKPNYKKIADEHGKA